MGVTHHLRSYVFGGRVDVDELLRKTSGHPSSIDPRAAIRTDLGPESWIYLFNHGSIVFWNVPLEDQTKYLEKLQGISGTPNLNPGISETFSVIVKEGAAQVEFASLTIDRLSDARREVIASTVAQSTSMEFYESIVEEAWVKVDALLLEMGGSGFSLPFTRRLNKQIAQTLALRSRVVRMLHLLDKPDLIWEDSVMDQLYGDLRTLFDLQERFQALEYKLQLIHQNLEVVVETARDRRLYWVELVIMVLILFEIVMPLFKR